jgi:hypothetical protein
MPRTWMARLLGQEMPYLFAFVPENVELSDNDVRAWQLSKDVVRCQKRRRLPVRPGSWIR